MKSMIIKLQVLSMAAIAVALGAVFVAVLSFGSGGVSAQHPMETPKGFELQRRLEFLQVAGTEFRMGKTHEEIVITDVSDGWITVLLRGQEGEPAEYRTFGVSKIEFYTLGHLPRRTVDNSPRGWRGNRAWSND